MFHVNNFQRTSVIGDFCYLYGFPKFFTDLLFFVNLKLWCYETIVFKYFAYLNVTLRVDEGGYYILMKLILTFKTKNRI